MTPGSLPLFHCLYFHCIWVQTGEFGPQHKNDMYSQHKPKIIIPHSTANCFLGNKKSLSSPKEQLHCTLWVHIKNITQNSSQSKLVYWRDDRSEDSRVQKTWAFCVLKEIFIRVIKLTWIYQQRHWRQILLQYKIFISVNLGLCKTTALYTLREIKETGTKECGGSALFS